MRTSYLKPEIELKKIFLSEAFCIGLSTFNPEDMETDPGTDGGEVDEF